MRRTHAAAAAAALLAVSTGVHAGQQEGRISSTMSATGRITDVPGIKVGQVTRTERPTGCTVVLAEAGAVAGVDVRGSAPGTIETDLLNPVNLVQQVHAVFLSGGSAFGLDVAAGVRKFLYERKIGFETRVAKVPIVPGAILFDLAVGNRPDIWPTAECGYRAAADATSGPVAEGNVGAGAGATIGKMGGGGAMKGGLGTASIAVPAGAETLIVGAIVAVNAVGDVIDPRNGSIVAGVRTPDGKGLADARRLLRESADCADTARTEHHDRRRCDQRPSHQGSGHEGRSNGTRWACASNLSRPHDGGWRRNLRARHGNDRGRRGFPSRRARQRT